MSWIDNIPDFSDNAKDNLDAIKNNLGLLKDSQIVDDNLDDDNPSNGWYYRLECGVQVCFIRDLGTVQINNSDGDLYRSERINWDFPASFNSTEYFAYANSKFSNEWAGVDNNGGTNNSIQFRIFKPVSEDIDKTINAWAIGRY